MPRADEKTGDGGNAIARFAVQAEST